MSLSILGSLTWLIAGSSGVDAGRYWLSDSASNLSRDGLSVRLLRLDARSVALASYLRSVAGLRLVGLGGGVRSDLMSLGSKTSDSLDFSISVNIVLLFDYLTVYCVSDVTFAEVVSIRSSLVRAGFSINFAVDLWLTDG